jgi:hypothetical protein
VLHVRLWQPMSGPADSPTSNGTAHPDADLQLLLAVVVRTRDEHRRELQRRAGSPELAQSREAALEALEEYVAALNDRRWPIPPRMHQDLRLLRALCGHRRAPDRRPR